MGLNGGVMGRGQGPQLESCTQTDAICSNTTAVTDRRRTLQSQIKQGATFEGLEVLNCLRSSVQPTLKKNLNVRRRKKKKKQKTNKLANSLF